MANSVDPDQMQHSVPSDLHLHCLLKGSTFLKNRHFIIQGKFNKLIYSINTIIKCSVSLSFLNWIKNEMIFFYGISELTLATLIQR